MFNRIKEMCKERGISIAKLEREAGLPGHTISHWKSNVPSVDKVLAVAAVLGVSAEVLYYGKGKGKE